MVIMRRERQKGKKKSEKAGHGKTVRVTVYD